MKKIKEKYSVLKDHLDEKSKRLWSATEALSVGYGGITKVEKETGISAPTIRKGIKEIKNPKIIEKTRIRKVGGGRKKLEKKDKNLIKDIEKLVEPITRGDPESPLRWTSKSTYKLADELNKNGHRVSYKTVGRKLQKIGYSLQSNKKTIEGKNHEDRDKQFDFINNKTKEFQQKKQPVISVDTKKKENIGNVKNNGKEYYKKGKASKVNTYDFIDKEKGKAVPYGVYDLNKNKGWVSVGISSDTAIFVVNGIKKWWNKMGKKEYKNATDIYINADGGVSNGWRVRLWKTELQKFASEINLNIHVSHFPPGTSKWNKIEHRMFSFISKNWRGKPLIDRATIVNLIGNTTTKTGLKILSELDENIYEKGIKVSDQDLEKVNLQRDAFHGEWNYIISP